MVGQAYLIPLQSYQFDLRSEKVNSIARLVELNIPTVPLPHVLLPSSFEFYRQNKKLAPQVESELAGFFSILQKAGYPATVRPSIFADIPGAGFIVANNVNLPALAEIKSAIMAGYDKVIKEFGQAVKIEFAHLIYGFYTASKAGVLYTEDGLGNVHLEAAFGEHTRLITRAEIQPDIYKINKKTNRVVEKKISEKEFTLKPSASGLEKIKLVGEERTKSVFTDQEIKRIYEYALRMEKEHGPQEIEAAVLRTGEIIFQDARRLDIKKQSGAVSSQNIPIYLPLQSIKGKIKKLTNYHSCHKMSQGWIVVTDNLEIDFITKLVHQFKPKGVILTRGSLTAHAVTILREAKIPSVLAQDLKTNHYQFCEIKANGEINCYS